MAEPSSSPATPDVTSATLAHDVLGHVASAAPVVLLPAFPLDRSMWRPVAERLAAAGVGAVLVDHPGLGGSPRPDAAPDLAVSAAAVIALLDGLGVRRAVVAGVSMGGYVALELARSHPERLAGLALVDTKAEADGEEARANRERIARAVESAGSRPLVSMLDGLLGATTRARRPDVVEQARAALLAAPPAGAAWSQRAMAARPDSTALLGGITCPVAVVVGEEDGISPPEVARGTAAALPDAVLTVLPRAGHLSPLEDPDGVTAALLALLLRTSPA